MISTLNNYAHDWWKIPSQINTPSIFNDQLKFEIRWYIEPSPDGYLVCSEAGEWRRLSYGMAAIKWVLILQMSPWKINGSSVGSLNRSVPTSTGTLKVEKPKRQRFQALTESPEFITKAPSIQHCNLKLCKISAGLIRFQWNNRQLSIVYFNLNCMQHRVWWKINGVEIPMENQTDCTNKWNINNSYCLSLHLLSSLIMLWWSHMQWMLAC